MPTPDEILRAQRTATRLDPATGARSSIFGSAGQVPAGVATPGLDPMPARAQTIAPPAAPDPARRMLFESRPAVDPLLRERAMATGPTAPVDAPRSIAQLRGSPASSLAPAAPVALGEAAVTDAGSKLGRLAAPGIIQRAASTAGRIGAAGGAIVGGIAGLAQLSKGTNQLLGDQPGGLIEGAARTAAGAAAVTPASLLPKALRVAGPVGAVASGSMMFTDAMGLPATGLSPSSLASRGVDAAMRNDTIRGYVNAMRGAMGMPLAEKPRTPGDLAVGGADAGAAPVPAAAPAAAPVAPGGRGAAAPVAAQDWFSTPEAAAANVAREVSAPAHRAGPITRAARPALERVAQLQGMAGRELAAPQEISRSPVAEAAAAEPGMQAYGPGGTFTPNVPGSPGAMELPAWEGDAQRPAQPEGKVLVDRGTPGGVIQSYFDARRGGPEKAAGVPEVAGTGVADLLSAWSASAGSSDPRVQAMHGQIGEFLAAQLRESGALQRAQLQAESGLAQQQESTRGTLGSASIRAAADERIAKASRTSAPATVQIDAPVMDPKTGEPMLDPLGQPVKRKSAAYWDANTQQFRPVQIEDQGQVQASREEYGAAIDALLKKGYNRQQAADYLRRQGVTSR